MTRCPLVWMLALGLVGVASTAAAGDPPKSANRLAPPTTKPPAVSAVTDAKRAFLDVARVLMSPRCRNCHPRGNAPLQTDLGRPHRMNVSRLSTASGLLCSACHQQQNSEAVGVFAGPPGAHHWQLPPEQTPMPFAKHTPTSLCKQLKDPARNGRRSLSDLLRHVRTDPLVLWGWNPGGRRTRPPMSHKDFVAAFARWVKGGGACPDAKR